MSQIDHLRALVKMLELPEPEKAKLARELNVKDPARRNVVIETINSEMKGAANRALSVWDDNPGRAAAVHLYRVPPFDGCTHRRLHDLILKRYGRAPDDGEWILLSATKRYTPHITRVKLTTKDFTFAVRLYHEHKFQCDDGKSTSWAHQDVEVHVDYRRPGGRVAQVFGTTGQARKALRLGLEELLAASIAPDRSPEQERFFVQVKFTERTVLALAQRLGLRCIELKGPDPTGELGGSAVYAPIDGEKKLALPADHPRVKERMRHGNDLADFAYEFPHPDGYEEYVEVHFTLTGHSHVTFTRACTRLAKDHLLGALRDVVAG